MPTIQPTVRADVLRNRITLLTAAREVFAEQGADASLSLVVARSGLGRGSLYRHFPNRFVLISAIFDENFMALENLAHESEGQPQRFQAVFTLLIEQLIEARGFVTVLLSESSKQPEFERHNRRLEDLLDELIRDAHLRNELSTEHSSADFSLVINILAGLVLHHPREELPGVIQHALRLMRLEMMLQ